MVLREPRPHEMLYLLMDILRIFIMVEQKEYQRSLALQILCLLSGSADRTPYWMFWKFAQPALNEDLCERELSSLARAVCRDSSGGELAYTDKQFRIGGVVRNILEKWEPERLTDNKSTKWSGSRTDIPSEDSDGQLVLQFFLLKIRELSVPAQFLSYTGAPKDWVDSVAAKRNAAHVLRGPMLTNTAPALRELLIKVRTKLTEPWDVDLSKWTDDIVPRFEAEVPEEQDDVKLVMDELNVPGVPEFVDDDDLVRNEMLDDETKQALDRPVPLVFVPLLMRNQVIPVTPIELKLPPSTVPLMVTNAPRTGRIPAPRKPRVPSAAAKAPRKPPGTRSQKQTARQQSPTQNSNLALASSGSGGLVSASVSSASAVQPTQPKKRKRSSRTSSSSNVPADSESEDPTYDPRQKR